MLGDGGWGLRSKSSTYLNDKIFALKSSTSPYFDNHSPESIHICTIFPSADSFKKGCCQLQAKVCAQITG